MMKVFVINLDRDKERWESISRQLEREGIDFERFPAIYGRDLSEELLKQVYSRRSALYIQAVELSKAQIGCALSHAYVYKTIKERGIEMALILEDDVVIPSGFGAQLVQLEKLIDASRPEVLLLSPARGSGGVLRTSHGPQPIHVRTFARGFFTSSYIVNNLSSRALWRKVFPIGDVADCWLRLHRHLVVDLLISEPALIHQDQDSFGSSTTADHQTVWDRSWRFAIQYKLRRLRFVVCDPLLAFWHRRFSPYSGVLKGPGK